MRKLALLLGLLSLPMTLTAAEPHEPHKGILEAARNHVLANAASFGGTLKVEAQPLDRRLRLARCDVPLQTYESPNGLKPGRSVVGVRCEGAKPWKIFVSVSIATLNTVVISKHPIARGHIIDLKDLIVTERDTARIHKSYFTEPAQLVGQRAKRNIATGRVLTPTMLAKNQLVKRGSRVEILARQGNLEVRMRGKALANGGKGDRIPVRNITSGREVTGTVIGSGVILVQE